MRNTVRILGNICLAQLLVVTLLSGVAVGEDPPDRPAPPLTYKAISDTKVYPKPELVKLGPAGFQLKDPTFGSKILRATDEKTASGNSILTPAGADVNTWNVDSTLFYVLNQGQRNIPFRFDPKTMKATRVEGLPFLGSFQAMSSFSYHDPNVIYGLDGRRNVIVTYDFATKKYTDVLDVGKVSGLDVGSISCFSVSANDVLSVTFGGTVQDTHINLMVYDTKTKTHHVWNTKEGTLDGKPVPGAPSFTQHASKIDLSGRYVWSVGRGVRGPIIWDVEKGKIYPMTVQKNGHRAIGYGEMVNDVHQWIYRKLDPEGISSFKQLMKHPRGQGYFRYDSHPSWNNARPDMKVPVVLATYHRKEQGDPKCVWGDEIIAVSTDGSMKVWRFAHHRSVIHMPERGPDGRRRRPSKYNFWDTPRGNVSRDGHFYMFTSNWGETLGKDRRGRPRQDVFIVKLEEEDKDITGTPSAR